MNHGHDWIARGLAGDRACLARLLTVIENDGPELGAVLRQAYPRVGRALRIGITGAPGVGKSTLIGAYIEELRRRGASVAVIAVDPSSTITGGAVLGDRVRMPQPRVDPGVFIRSLAARGQLGGLVVSAVLAADLLDAAGWDVVVIETVGVGQSETDIAGIADCTAVICAPGLGDEIQGVKAGILEVADVLVLNKADLPHADLAARQLRRMVKAGGTVTVVETVATTRRGIAELADVLERRGRQAERTAGATLTLVLRRLAASRLERWINGADSDLGGLCAQVLAGSLDIQSAAREILAAAARREV